MIVKVVAVSYSGIVVTRPLFRALALYSCTKFEVSSFTNYKFTEGVLKFNNSASAFRYFVTHEMGLSKIYLGTKFEISSFTRSKDTAPVQRNGWVSDGGVPKLTRGYPSLFI